MPAKKKAPKKAPTKKTTKKGASAAKPGPPPPFHWTNKKARLGDLVEWEKNPRTLTSDQAEQLRASMKKFGYIEPIQVTPSGRIVGGHMRKNVLIQRLLVDLDTMIDVRVCDREPTEAEYEEMAIRLNKNQADWDFDALANNFEVSELVEWGFEPKEFGMDDVTVKQVETTDSGVCPKCKRPL